MQTNEKYNLFQGKEIEYSEMILLKRKYLLENALGWSF